MAAAVAAAVAVAMAMGMGIGIGNGDEEGDGDEDEPFCAPLFPILKSKIGTIENSNRCGEDGEVGAGAGRHGQRWQ